MIGISQVTTKRRFGMISSETLGDVKLIKEMSFKSTGRAS